MKSHAPPKPNASGDPNAQRLTPNASPESPCNLSLEPCNSAPAPNAQRLTPNAYHLRTEALTLLQCGREEEAEPLLTALERRGCAQSAYNLGIMCCRRGWFATALDHLYLCKQTNPAHPRAHDQMTAIIRYMAGPSPPPPSRWRRTLNTTGDRYDR